MLQREHILPAHSILKKRYEDDPTTLVGSEGYLKYDANERSGFAVPDCVVAFGVDPAAIRKAKGYVINEVGKPPDFILEVASETTGVRDYKSSAEFTDACWRANTGVSTPPAANTTTRPLAGDILVDGEYRRIDIRRDPDGSLWGYSPALGLYLVWEDGILRFFDPETGEFLRDLSAAEKRGDEAERRLTESERRVFAERAARDEAERQRASERAARIDAERARRRSGSGVGTAETPARGFGIATANRESVPDNRRQS